MLKAILAVRDKVLVKHDRKDGSSEPLTEFGGMKFHMAMHYTQYIREFGMPRIYDAEMWESSHKWAKAEFRRMAQSKKGQGAQVLDRELLTKARERSKFKQLRLSLDISRNLENNEGRTSGEREGEDESVDESLSESASVNGRRKARGLGTARYLEYRPPVEQLSDFEGGSAIDGWVVEVPRGTACKVEDVYDGTVPFDTLLRGGLGAALNPPVTSLELSSPTSSCTLYEDLMSGSVEAVFREGFSLSQGKDVRPLIVYGTEGRMELVKVTGCGVGGGSHSTSVVLHGVEEAGCRMECEICGKLCGRKNFRKCVADRRVKGGCRFMGPVHECP